MRSLVTCLMLAGCVAVLADATAAAPVGAVADTATAAVPAGELAGRTVQSLRITGARHSEPAVIRDRLETRVGEPLDPGALDRDRRALLSLGAFTEVTVTTRPVAGGAAVTVHVEEASTYKLSPSLMINAEGGLSVGGTLSTANAVGLLVQGQVGVLFGGVQQTHIEVHAPRFRGYYGDHDLVYFNRQRDNSVLDFFEVANEVFATFAPRIGEATRVGVMAGYQRLRADADGKTLSSDHVDDVNTLGVLFGIDTAGAPVIGRHGWWGEILVERTGLLGGQAEFWRSHLDVRRYQHVAARHTLVMTGLVTLTSGTVGEDVAPWQTYHLGGTNTVRGWEVGSRSGKNQAIGTAEWRWTVRDPDPLALPLGVSLNLGVQIAAFTDVGLAWSGEAEARLDRVLDGYGLGLRFVGPGIGRLRLDVAHGEDSPTVRFYVGSGEKADVQRRRVR